MINPAAAQLVKKVLHGSGLYHRVLASRRFPGVAVLCYHGVRSSEGAFSHLHVTPEELEEHCALLSSACDPISLDQLLAAMQGEPLPPRPVLITFDDGYRDVLTRGRPILERYRMPFVVFVCSEATEKRRWLWYDWAAQSHSSDQIQQLKRTAWPEFAALTETPLLDDTSEYATLSPAELKTLGPLAEIASHTANHAILSHAPVDIRRHELETSRRDLESWTDRRVRALAYPNGQPGLDFGDDVFSEVKAAGYACAFSTAPGFVTATTPMFAMPRFLMLRGITAAELAHRLAFSWRRTVPRVQAVPFR